MAGGCDPHGNLVGVRAPARQLAPIPNRHLGGALRLSCETTGRPPVWPHQNTNLSPEQWWLIPTGWPHSGQELVAEHRLSSHRDLV